MTSTKKGREGIMKFWAMLRIVVDGFGQVDIFLTLWTSTGAENKYFFPTHVKFSNILLASVTLLPS